MTVRLSHRELSLALFALEGGELPENVQDPCAPDEHACPVAESLEELGNVQLTPEKKLARHLVKHLQEGWIECGLMDLGQVGLTDGGPASGEPGLSVEEHRMSGNRMAESLSQWNCEIELAPEERRLLLVAINRLPGSAWVSMPWTMWRLRKKLKNG